MADHAALTAQGVKRSFGRLEALRGVDLRLERGRTLALVGPNGAGKTTLLKIAARLMRPSSGRVTVLGADVGREPERVLGALGFLTHQPFLYEALTAEENVLFFARLYGLRDARQRCHRALERVGLQGRTVSKPVHSLSRGQRQRTGLARALVHEPELLLFDEPFSGLDPGASAALSDALTAHRSEGGSAVVTTHDLGRARELADRVAALVRGRVAFELETSELQPGELERRYAQAVQG
jgi:heme exporter protein A